MNRIVRCTFEAIELLLLATNTLDLIDCFRFGHTGFDFEKIKYLETFAATASAFVVALVMMVIVVMNISVIMTVLGSILIER